ncbi:MAG: 50S ribosomal protein L18 [Candidatus Aenigmarchaeota archaeon]|nr:50S ribosomal protein L18 [Candidatus Aenigmarchaeota archaeon]
MKRIPHRRRRERKTDYRKRLALLKSGKYRLVVRKSNNSTLGQIVEYNKNGDKTLLSVTTFMLRKLGWKHHCGNIPAAYLAGLLLGKKALEKKINDAVLDMGLQTSTKGNRIYAFLKGVLDAGINVPHSPEVLPDENRIKGSHISEEVVKNFEEVRKKILGE